MVMRAMRDTQFPMFKDKKQNLHKPLMRMTGTEPGRHHVTGAHAALCYSDPVYMHEKLEQAS